MAKVFFFFKVQIKNYLNINNKNKLVKCLQRKENIVIGLTNITHNKTLFDTCLIMF